MQSSVKNILTKLKKSKLFKDSVAYTFLNSIEKAIPFLILPILTRLLTKEEVGYYILYQAIIEVVVPIMTLQIDQAILLNYFQLNKTDFKVYFSNAIILFFLFYVVLFIVLFALSNPISTWLSFPVFWLNIIFAIVIFRFLTTVRQHLWQIKYKIRHYGLFTIGISIIKNVLGLFLVIKTSLAWEGIIVGHFTGYAVFGIIALITFYKEKLIHLTSKLFYLQDIIKIGAPLSIHRLGLWLGKAANRVIINTLLGAAATGSYGIGATFGGIVTVLEQAFAKAFKPHLFDFLKNINQNNKNKIVKMSYLIYAVIFLISLSLFLFGYFLVGFVFGEEYLETRKFMFPLILAAMVKGFFELHVNYILFSKKTMHITKITITAGILNVIFAWWGTKHYGLIGTAYSLAIINFLQYIATFYVSNKLIPMPWLFPLKKFNDTKKL